MSGTALDAGTADMRSRRRWLAASAVPLTTPVTYEFAGPAANSRGSPGPYFHLDRQNPNKHTQPVKLGKLSIFLKQISWQLQSMKSVETKCHQRTYSESHKSERYFCGRRKY